MVESDTRKPTASSRYRRGRAAIAEGTDDARESDDAQEPTTSPHQQGKARGDDRAGDGRRHNESEQITGWFTMIDENLAVPFETTVLGVPVTVERLDLNRSEQNVAVAAASRSRSSIYRYPRRRRRRGMDRSISVGGVQKDD
jgi:hypothetical protein